MYVLFGKTAPFFIILYYLIILYESIFSHPTDIPQSLVYVKNKICLSNRVRKGNKTLSSLPQYCSVCRETSTLSISEVIENAKNGRNFRFFQTSDAWKFHQLGRAQPQQKPGLNWPCGSTCTDNYLCYRETTLKKNVTWQTSKPRLTCQSTRGPE